MRKVLKLLMLMGAAALTVGVILSKKDEQKKGECFPEYCGTCGDDDVMQRECGQYVDDYTLLHHRGSV